ncbi:hypothetical protein [Paraflavitalea sp. CAU 1676]|uniref:hypothetical protein n=1 Tax=Paraflavitalea sp. CAU 1676 TaxID=3032598 RepID=UPI0023DBE9FF|nr:hypothetical protein [Paraflavitalea sp. CAU 1676]MDF2188506.1 hypothetical protein [Paraflavitalea sp. CAU 1676]
MFRGSRRLAAFDSLQIDLKKNVVYFRGKELLYEESKSGDTGNNTNMGPVSGQLYKFEEGTPVNTTALSSINILQYSLTIGKTERDGKPLLFLMAVKLEKGMPVLNIALPVQLD